MRIASQVIQNPVRAAERRYELFFFRAALETIFS
jgi:hypothetical protein